MTFFPSISSRWPLILACVLLAPLGETVAQGADSTAAAERLKVAVVQLGQEPTLAENCEKIMRLTSEAAATGAQLVVFPEAALAVPAGVPMSEVNSALTKVAEAARVHGVYVVVVTKFLREGKSRYHNQLHVLGPDGKTVLIYDIDSFAKKAGDPKLVEIAGVLCSFIICSDRWSRPVESLPPVLGARIMIECADNFDTEWLPELFEGGMSTRAMWFQVNGVWSILTIGDDVIWNEMAELAALRGARLHCHLRHDRNTSPADLLLNDQIMAGFASYRMLTIVANPLFPELKGDPDASFCQGSGIWDDLKAGDWCARKINAGRPWEKVFSSPRIVPGSANPVRQTGYWRKGSPQYRSWMMAEVAGMDQDAAENSQTTGTKSPLSSCR